MKLKGIVIADRVIKDDLNASKRKVVDLKNHYGTATVCKMFQPTLPFFTFVC